MGSPDDLVGLSHDIQAQLAGLPLLPPEDLEALVKQMNSPVLVRQVDVSHVLHGPTVAFLVAGPEDLPGTPAHALVERLHRFWDERTDHTFEAYQRACDLFERILLGGLVRRPCWEFVRGWPPADLVRRIIRHRHRWWQRR